MDIQIVGRHWKINVIDNEFDDEPDEWDDEDGDTDDHEEPDEDYF